MVEITVFSFDIVQYKTMISAKPVASVSRRGGWVEIGLASEERFEFDQVVLACHADEALAPIDDPLPMERQIPSRFQYQANRALLHTDERLMPHSRRVWSS